MVHLSRDMACNALNHGHGGYSLCLLEVGRTEPLPFPTELTQNGSFSGLGFLLPFALACSKRKASKSP